VSAPRSRFADHQQRFFEEADAPHFFWQTRNPHFADTERALLRGFPVVPGHSILEVGCGEGGNLVNLLSTTAAPSRLVVGCDLFPRKLSFARAQGIRACFVGGDALALPFRDGAFDAILCRDVLHHLEDPEPAIAELRRVCRPEGTVWIVEPNGRNLLIRGLAILRPHERGQLRNSIESLTALVAPWFPRVEVEVRQPFPVYRVVLHYQFGLPRLGSLRWCQALLDLLDRVARAVWPHRRWAYIVVKLGRAAG
jgi:ubiquinone/menaquinone biosynthesis C-methylase UbiE